MILIEEGKIMKREMGILVSLFLALMMLGILLVPVYATGNKIVNFTDSTLENIIRWTIGKPTGDIYNSDLAKITQLVASDTGVSNLSGLEYCTNLENLYLQRNYVTDLSPIVGLSKLRAITLTYSYGSPDFTLLSKLSSLEYLSLQGCNVSDISFLGKLNKLQTLWLGMNTISDISPLTKLTRLQYLSLYFNYISDISPLVDNKGLRAGDSINLAANELDLTQGSDDTQDIQILIDRGVIVQTGF